MIIVHITEKMLREAQACEDGINFWRTLATPSPKGTLRVRVKWTVLHQLWASVAAPSFYGWCRDKGLIPQLSMTCADLRGADLRGADLRGADLRGADLRGADLRSADLRSADLRSADLRSADLYGAFGNADLYGANLRSAFGNAEVPGWKLVNGIYQKGV